MMDIVELSTALQTGGLGTGSSVAERMAFREYVEALQDKLRSDEAAHNEFMDSCPLMHKFHDGVYIRQIFMPKGSFVIGRIHKKSHHNIISSGRALVRTECGGTQIYDATEHPLTFQSERGTKRVLWIEEDMYWTTIHRTDATTVEEVEAEIFENFYADFVREFPEFKLDLLEAAA